MASRSGIDELLPAVEGLLKDGEGLFLLVDETVHLCQTIEQGGRPGHVPALLAGTQGLLVVRNRGLGFSPGPMGVAQEKSGLDLTLDVLLFPEEDESGACEPLRLVGIVPLQMEFGKRQGHNGSPLRVFVSYAQFEGFFQQGQGLLPLSLLPVGISELVGEVRDLPFLALCPALQKKLFHFRD